jgi:hypothetical protein
MPKEVIDNSQKLGTDGEIFIDVQWGRDHNEIQIGTYREALPNPGGVDVNTRGWFINLDRDRINRLIRTLRRARDQACGADA